MNQSRVKLSEQQKLDLIARHVAAESAHDLAGTLATLHPDCVFEDTAMGRVWRGHAGAEAHYREWWNGLDAEVASENRSGWLPDGSFIAETGFRCRHVGTFLDIPATGRSFRLSFVVVVSFRDGLMLGERFYYSLDGLLMKLGAAPRAPYAGEAA
jgi:ketosteroid isomerase-like protein